MKTKDINPLLEKWQPVLSGEGAGAFSDIPSDRIEQVAALLEAGEKTLLEAAPTTETAGVAGFNQILIPMIRRAAPNLLAFDFLGVQPMQTPVSLIYAMKAKYGTQAGPEALAGEANASFGGDGATLGTDIFSVAPAYVAGSGQSTSVGEAENPWAEMTVSVESVTVTAKTVQLRAEYSQEVEQDLMASHNLSVRSELIRILSTEVASEINRLIVRTVYFSAKLGAQNTVTAGTFDLAADSDGRHQQERFVGLAHQIEVEANIIAVESLRGQGNVIICSPAVASALESVGNFSSITQGSQMSQQNSFDPTGASFVGVWRGRYRVFVDPFVAGDFVVVLYKGIGNNSDAGGYFAPYRLAEMAQTTTSAQFNQALGIKSRFGLVANPYTSFAANSNTYFRKFKVIF